MRAFTLEHPVQMRTNAGVCPVPNVAVYMQVELQDAKHFHQEGGLVSLVVKDSRPR